MKKVFKSRDDITVADVLERYHYSPETGMFLHARSSTRARIGTVAGSVNKLGYLMLSFDGLLCLAHRVAWLVVHGKWPDDQLDHVDGDRTNNMLSNLRECSHAENLQNRGRHSNNRSGVIGVCRFKPTGEWQAYICANGKQIHLGYFATIEEAAAARAAAKEKYHQFNPIDRA
ncbi:HNH endonuclease [Xanthomonas phage L522]|nr:HNH endonuclease [Xanthomonas phage L522]